MARKKRNKEQILEHRKIISRLMLAGGRTHQEMADELEKETGMKLSRRQITYDVNKIRDEWQNEKINNYDELVRRELLRLDETEEALWRAVRAAAEGTTERVIKKINEAPSEEEPRIIKEVVETQKPGSPSAALFSQIIKCQKERRKLLGIYRQVDTNVQINVKGYSVVSPDDWPTMDRSHNRLDDGNVIDGQLVQGE